MSWDIMIFNSKQKIDIIENLDEDQLEPIDFCSIFRQHFRQVREENDYREINGEDYTISYHTDNKPVNHKIISITGERGLLEIVELSKQLGWQLFDTALGEMLDLENPGRNGYKIFKEYAQQVLNDK